METFKDMPFGDAIELLKKGKKKVCRAAWNGNSMWLFHVSCFRAGNGAPHGIWFRSIFI